jgi:hypothetical protein
MVRKSHSILRTFCYYNIKFLEFFKIIRREVIMKKKFLLGISAFFLTSTIIGNATYAEEGPIQTSDEVVDKIIDVPTSQSEVIDEDTFTDTSFREPMRKSDEIGTFAHECECGGGSYKNPIKIKSSTIDLYGVPLEYGIVKGNLVIMRRPGLYYYKQNATTSYVNMVSASIVSKMATGYSSYIAGKGVAKVPYMAKLFNSLNQPKPFNYGDYARTAAGWQVEQNLPIWGRIVSAPVPSSGTKEVLVYVSKTGKDYSWDRRILFTIKPDKTISYKKWSVK